jgi:hypothetical protein
MIETDAALLFGFEGDLVDEVRFAGVAVSASVRIDPVEVQRRADAGLAPGLDHDLSEALAELPVDWPVPWSSVHPLVRLRLEHAPSGVVELTDLEVIRRWRPAVTVTGVFTVARRQWRPALRKVSLFAPDAPRGLVLRDRPADQGEVLDAARGLGIGLAAPASSARAWQLLLAPSHSVRPVPGPRHWRFLEAAYEAWLRAGYDRNSAQLFR